MITSDQQLIVGNKSYIVYTSDSLKKLLLILWPYLTIKFNERLLNLNVTTPIYIRILINNDNRADYDGWGEIEFYDMFHDKTITKIDCKDGLPNWIKNL